jgi:hypothetical protein
MKHILMLVVMLIAGVSGEAFARLGNTTEQVNALFGKPTDPRKLDSDGITTNMYKNPTGEYIAVVRFLKGRSVAEAYSRVDRHQLYEKESSIFLQGNSAGNKWEKETGKESRLDMIRPQSTCLVRNDHGKPDTTDSSSLLIQVPE